MLAHRVWGLPLFLAVMYGIFWLTFTVWEIPMGWIEAGIGWLGENIVRSWPASPDSPLLSLLVDGIIGGVGGVLVFLPNIVLLFLGLSFLEDTGYLARAAYLMDRYLSRVGLHGKSFIPMLVGFGCTVPAIMATRTIMPTRMITRDAASRWRPTSCRRTTCLPSATAAISWPKTSLR